jgi:hypothetical protein
MAVSHERAAIDSRSPERWDCDRGLEMLDYKTLRANLPVFQLGIKSNRRRAGDAAFFLPPKGLRWKLQKAFINLLSDVL